MAGRRGLDRLIGVRTHLPPIAVGVTGAVLGAGSGWFWHSVALYYA